jgi:uncharacterized membrane protein
MHPILLCCFQFGLLGRYAFIRQDAVRPAGAVPIKGAVAGGLLFGHAVCHGWAISMTKAVYMIAVKRLSILFGVIYGGLFFHECHILYRMVGTGLMVAGAAIVTLKGL